MTYNKVAITGVSGFIGGSFAEYFSQRGFSVIGLSREVYEDTRYPVIKISYETEYISRIIDEIDPSVIMHAAGSASVGESLTDPQNDFEKTVSLFQSLLEGVRLSGKKPLVVFPSSAAVYGNPEFLPVSETAPLKPISPYGYHKVMCEIMAREYSECFSIPTLVVRLFSVFGPRQERLLLWELFEQFKKNPEVFVRGTGDETRDYIYIDDLAEAVISVIPKLERIDAVLNIASGSSLTVREVATKIKKYLKSEKSIVFKGEVCAGNPLKWLADISLFKELIGENQLRTFDERLKGTLQKWQT